MRIGIFGRGRLGRCLAEGAAAAESQIAWQTGRETGVGDFRPPAPVDVVVDASVGTAVPSHLRWAASAGTPMVVAATGEDFTAPAREAARRIGVVLAPNGSLSVALMVRFAGILGRYAAVLEKSDLYLWEHHHGAKRDAPSGTALRLKAAAEAGARALAGGNAGDSVHEVATASVRAGHEPGHHVLGLDTPGEVLELRHRARSRDIFADGLLRAAEWIRGRRGLFTMDDVAAAILDPLFPPPSIPAPPLAGPHHDIARPWDASPR